MTINQLQEALITEVKRILGNVHLKNNQGEQAEIRGFSQSLPIPSIELPEIPEDTETCFMELKENLEESLVPYFVVRAENVSYPEDLQENPRANILLLFGLYDENPDMSGYYLLSMILERIVVCFRQNPVLDSFWCEKKMELAFQEDDSFPQFFGGLEMTWNLPAIEMEEFN